MRIFYSTIREEIYFMNPVAAPGQPGLGWVGRYVEISPRFHKNMMVVEGGCVDFMFFGTFSIHFLDLLLEKNTTK